MPVIEERLRKLSPPPLRHPLPILIGSGGENYPTHRRPARAHLERFRRPRSGGRKSTILDDWCERVGRDPREIERSISVRPNQIRNLDRYVENGITHLIIGVSGPNYDLCPLKELIRWRDGYHERNGESAAS
jgi:hypothetical protein